MEHLIAWIYIMPVMYKINKSSILNILYLVFIAV